MIPVLTEIGEKTMPARANVATMRELQERLQPNIFTPKGAYDGKKNLFTSRKLELGDNNSRVVGYTSSCLVTTLEH